MGGDKMFNLTHHEKITVIYLYYYSSSGTRYQGSGENYIIWSLMICTHQILFGLSNKEK
jgi:hypothetical protein